MCIVYIYVALASYNTEFLTLPMSSIENIVDEAANIAVLDSQGKIKRPTKSGRQRAVSTPMDRIAAERLDWRTLWNEGTDAVMDVPVGGVCEILYGGQCSGHMSDLPCLYLIRL